MSLRESLRQSVTSFPEKCCTVAGHRECNNATNQSTTATTQATTHATTPMESSNNGVIGATPHATTLQQALKNRATSTQQIPQKQVSDVASLTSIESRCALHQEDELRRLVLLVSRHNGFSKEDYEEALTHALCNPVDAMTCFASLANKAGLL